MMFDIRKYIFKLLLSQLIAKKTPTQVLIIKEAIFRVLSNRLFTINNRPRENAQYIAG